MPQRTKWHIMCFCKETENHVQDFDIDVPLPFLKDVFNQPDEEELGAGCYPVGPREAAMLKERLGIDFDLDRYCYFVELVAVS